MKKIGLKITLLTVLAICFSSCLQDLNRYPFYGINAASVYSNPANYINLLAKLYAGFAVTGQSGGDASNPDINTNNQGYTEYLREVWNLEELTTDEAFWTYNDPDIYSLHYMTWTSLNQWVQYGYDRIIYEVTLCNSFISNSSDANISIHKFTGQTATTIREYRAQARFLKALALYHGLDLFGNIADVTNESQFPGSNFPKLITRVNLFNYIESELLDIQNDIGAPRSNAYGEADQACVWALLARLYLNAQVYTGTPRYTDAITYCNKVIGAGYSLSPSYRDLFLNDNNSSVASNEIIFSINFDGLNTTAYGGSTYLTQAPIDNTATPDTVSLWLNIKDSVGMDGTFHRCLHTTSAFVTEFNDQNGFPDSLDRRYMFFNHGLTLNIDSFDIPSPNNDRGWTIIKFRNISSTGVPGSSSTFSSGDVPIFRLADIYLIYAESVVQGGSGGSMSTALGYINDLRQRAFGNSNHNLSGSLTMANIMQERSREMQWEFTRRSDLIRWGLYTGSAYLWPWKGDVAGGTSVDAHFNIFPIPNSDIVANPNLTQNPNY